MHALKIESAGIQKYIFNSNRLKVCLGASYIIEHLLFNTLLKEVLKKLEYDKSIVDKWWTDEYEEIEPNTEELQIGYIGGGNMLMFGSEEKLKKIDSLFKLETLKCFPGLEVYSAIIEGNISATGPAFTSLSESLVKEVNKNRSAYPFINKTANHGLYKNCSLTYGPASHYWKVDEKWVTDEALSKVQYGELANDAHTQHEAELLDTSQHEVYLLDEDDRSKYSFPVEFEKLSQKNTKSYIAIVHIDGNNLGQAFINAKNISETQSLSKKVRSIARKALKETISEGIIQKLQTNSANTKCNLGDLQLVKYKPKIKTELTSSEKFFLPIRPIITGGDDVTFVCEGTLGIPLARLFLEKFHSIGKDMGLLDGKIHACAGVAIIKEKYPFYRGYELSEELIKEAKKESRKHAGSYLSFMVAGYGTSTSLSDLKEEYAQKKFYTPTYKVSSSESEMPHIDELESLIKELRAEDESGQRKMPTNKLMDIRQGLVNGNIKEVWKVVSSRFPVSGKINPTEKTALTFEAIDVMDFINEAYINTEDGHK